MKSTLFVAALFALASFSSCRPKAINIDIKQQAPALSISSVCYDAHTVFVAAGYSISSLKGLSDTARDKGLPELAKGLLADSAIVTITGPEGRTDTLHKEASGLYSRRDLQLAPGAAYTLFVKDLKKGSRATALTTFYGAPVVDVLEPVVTRSPGDSSVKIHLHLSGAQVSGRYFISYNTLREAKTSLSNATLSLASLYSFTPRRIELVDGAAATTADGLDKAYTLINVRPDDTLVLNMMQMDDAYYRYLTAYKRTGSLLNQITGEPINLPTNIVTGLGYFALSQPRSAVYALSRF